MAKFNKFIPIIALLITVFLFATVLLISASLEQKRQNNLEGDMQQIYNSLSEMQIYMLMSDTYDKKMACFAYTTKLQDLDKSTWDLGQKIDQYRVASEQFRKDPYYLTQKRLFNDNEMLYLMLLKKVKKDCATQQPIVLFFYKNSEDCKKCDDQSFILTDIKKSNDAVATFSFDTEINVTTVDLLTRYYEITEYPCIVINDKAHCGIQDKNTIMEELCQNSSSLMPECVKYPRTSTN